MKFVVTMKDPDTLSDAIFEAVEESVTTIPTLQQLERDAVIEQRCEAVQALCNKWFEYGEYLRVEIDTEAETCTVLGL